MLRRFIYLNRELLAEYVTALEGGLVTESTRRKMNAGSGKLEANVHVAGGSGQRSSEDEETITLNDTDGARFQRLLTAAKEEPDKLGWTEVGDPDTEFSHAGIGAMISWECDVYVPEIVRMLASSGEAAASLNLIRDLLPSARALGLPTQGIPGDQQMSAMSSMLSTMNTGVTVVGEDDESEWRVWGPLKGDLELDALDGRAVFVGKVREKISANRWKPFISVPGSAMGSREQRRRIERQAPAAGKEDEYLAGPALTLDILAIYR